MIQEPNVAETFKTRAKERNKSLTQGDLDYKNASIEEFRENLFLFLPHLCSYFSLRERKISPATNQSRDVAVESGRARAVLALLLRRRWASVGGRHGCIVRDWAGNCARSGEPRIQRGVGRAACEQARGVGDGASQGWRGSATRWGGSGRFGRSIQATCCDCPSARPRGGRKRWLGRQRAND